MNKEPKMLSDYLRTENGRAVLKKLNAELDRLGREPAKETGYKYSLVSEAVYFFEEACADAKPGEEDFDMEVDEGLFDEDPNLVVATVLGRLWYDDFNYEILGCGDSLYDELCNLWRDYRA